MLPLNGIRVLDLSTVVFGPYASQMLADYGADVIKIEAPEGDSTRKTGPTTESGMSAIFLGVNRGKRSVVLDLKTAPAREALLKLVDTADVLMHSIRPQKLAAIGLDPETVRTRNPRLVYVGLHGFAEDGPYGGMPAYDDIIQGMSGCAALMERQTGTPQYFPTIAGDKTCGLVAGQAILSALFHRERTGEGAYVEVPMFEAMVAFNLVEHVGKDLVELVVFRFRVLRLVLLGLRIFLSLGIGRRFWLGLRRPNGTAQETERNCQNQDR